MVKITCFLFIAVGHFTWAQTQEAVDFLAASAKIEVHPLQGKITGDVTYSFTVNARKDSVFLDARHMHISGVLLNEKPVKFRNSGAEVIVYSRFKPRSTHRIQIEYAAEPEQAVYFLGWDREEAWNKQVWTQGQGKYTSHWLPSIDDMNDKVAFGLQITFDKGYSVLANGELVERLELGDKIVWKYNMDKPMSSYLVAFAIGKFDSFTVKNNSGVRIETYYYPQDRFKAEPTYRHTGKIMDFLQAEMGTKYPWKSYRQVPVKDFLYAGMENTGITIFSDQFVVDSIAYEDKNYVNVNAHEMAHQWFGNLVTEQSSAHHWLHEGFASYYALMAEKEIFGLPYFSWQLFNKAQMLQSLSEEGEGEALTDPGASSITFYDKGAWAVAILRHKLGNDNFKKGVSTFLQKYAYRNVTIPDLLNTLEETSEVPLGAFRETWLDRTAFPYAEAMAYLVELNPEFKILLDFQAAGDSVRKLTLPKIWNSGISSFLKSHLIRNHGQQMSLDFKREVFQDSSLKVRQAMVIQMQDVPPELKTEFESALMDPSYVTREYALFKLWVAFPQDRARYLDLLKGIDGMPDYNIKTLWLLLASLTEGYTNLEERVQYLDQLRAFTDRRYSTETRQRAFTLIAQAGLWSENNFADLISSTTHHQWQFREWARNLVDRLWEDQAIKARLLLAAKKLKDQDLRYIESKQSNP